MQILIHPHSGESPFERVSMTDVLEGRVNPSYNRLLQESLPQEEQLSSDDRRALCRFLEEALCNVGKHAVGAKRLTVLCLATETENLIRVEDNGKTGQDQPESNTPGRGAQQALALAQRLHGTFLALFRMQRPLRRPKRWRR